MHGRFMLTPANVLFLELRYEILKFFMHTSFLYNLEDILQEKSANLHAVLKNSHKLCQDDSVRNDIRVQNWKLNIYHF